MNLKNRNLALVIKSDDLTDDGTFKGYGSVFDVVDSYSDVIVKGAFTETIKKHKANGTMPALLWQHDATQPIGVYTKMEEDEHGLYLEGKLALLTEKGREAYELLRMGALNGLSIGFNVPRGGMEWNEDEGINFINQVELWETSIVTFPANEAAQVAEVRQHVGHSEKNFERFLRDAGGFSKSEAAAIVCHGFKGLAGGLRDADDDQTSTQSLEEKLAVLQASMKVAKD